MVFPVLNEFIEQHFESQSEAARSLHVSVQQFNRIVNGKTPIGWAILGRMWYFWRNEVFFSQAVIAMTTIGNYLYQRNGDPQ